jgi:hypothetical protein
MRRRASIAVLVLTLTACGSDEATPPDAGPPPCMPPPGPAIGSLDGHADPLGAGPDEARAGRIDAADLPAVPSGLITWKGGDFVLANDRIAIVIEDVGDSDLYDPWGGRPVGMARVENGVLVEPSNFGEFFLLTGRSTILTQSVSVVADGSAGGPAIVRVTGPLRPLPFIASVAAPFATFEQFYGSIDYELAPGAEKVDIRMRYVSPRTTDQTVAGVLHGLMYTKRTPAFLPGSGFEFQLDGDAYISLVDDAATSWAYVPNDGPMQSGLSVSGFVGAGTRGFTIPACAEFDRLHASLVIGGPGLDGVQAATARVLGTAQREITGTVHRGTMGAPGVRVHAVDATTGQYYTRTTTTTGGAFTLRVPANATVQLDAYRRGDSLGTATVGPADPAPLIDMPAGGRIQVTVSTPGGAALPARVQVVPAGASVIPTVPARYGEGGFSGRLHVEFATTGSVTVPAPVGEWEVIVSRGYEYDLFRQTVTVAPNATVQVDATLDRVVATPGVLCGDFHIHTDRSNDSADPGPYKVAGAVADGLELPVRSDHEYVGSFAREIADLGIEQYANGIGSIELTSMEVWGHMGVFPLTPDPVAVNAGAPKWQTYPSPESPDVPVETMNPVAVFDMVRARPENPIVIINHPRGGANYFQHVGLDPATGLVDVASEWDTAFTLIEVFNDASWGQEQTKNVPDWLALLRGGRHVFAIGSSDSHGLSGSPVGYPRTCIDAGTDDPRQVDGALVRDRMAAGHHTVSGGIYVTARVGTAGPGDTATGLGPTADVEVEVQAATWIDVDAIDVVVDGAIVDTIPILPGDADPGNPVVRWRGTIPVTVSASGMGFVIIAVEGDAALEPVHPGRMPFGVTNPIFLEP